MADIKASSEQVSIGVKQISKSSISLAEGATKQAGAIEELNTTIHKISKQSENNAENFEKASVLASKTKLNADEGNKQMDSMLLAMEEINNASNSISNIIKVIDDIAFQTNILALNAVISQQAAKETTELIESTVVKVSEGSKIANLTADTLKNIIEQINEISNLVDTCALESKKQEQSIEEVSGSIAEISSVTQANTATSEESADSSEELYSQADVFYSSITQFKLRQIYLILKSVDKIYTLTMLFFLCSLKELLIMEEELIKIISKLKFNLFNIENVKILKDILNKVDEKYTDEINIPKNLGYTLISFWPNLEVQKENYDENLIAEINDIYSEFIFDTIVCLPYVTEEEFNAINSKIDKIMLDFFNLTMDILLDLRNFKGIDNNKLDNLNKLLDDVNLIYNNKDYISKKFVNCFLSFFICLDNNFHYYEEEKLFKEINTKLYYKVVNILCESI